MIYGYHCRCFNGYIQPSSNYNIYTPVDAELLRSIMYFVHLVCCQLHAASKRIRLIGSYCYDVILQPFESYGEKVKKEKKKVEETEDDGRCNRQTDRHADRHPFNQ